jgi:hypothetical protein
MMVDGYRLRWDVYRLMREWGLEDPSIFVSTYSLIRGDDKRGSDSYSDDSVTEEDVRTFKLLLSDNGYAVYRMLLARRGVCE